MVCINLRKRFSLHSLQRKFTSVKCKTRPQFRLNSLYFILSSNHRTDLTLTIFKFKQAKYEQTRLTFLKALISGFIKLLSKRYELNLNSIISVSIEKVTRFSALFWFKDACANLKSNLLTSVTLYIRFKWLVG